MNNGAFGENFPYTNFHDLNMDWILQVVKEFKGEYEQVSKDVEHVDEIYADIQTLMEQIPMFLTNVLTPDSYAGSDSERLQTALDELKDTGGIIVLTREYTLTENIFVRQDSNDNHSIILAGFGKQTIINMNSFSFVGTVNGRTGGLWFTNTAFTGTGTAFDCSALIRMRFHNCYFTDFNKVFFNGNSQGSNQIMQSIYVDSCMFRDITTVFHNQHNGIFDIHVTNSIVESSGTFFHCQGDDFIALVSVTNNCIEGCEAVFIASPNQAIDQCVFSNNYFELNQTYFNLSNALFIANMKITDNFIGESNNIPFVNLPSAINPTYGYLTVERNTLADRTARTAVFQPNTNEMGAYRGLIYGQNRFDNLTQSNNSNNKLPPRNDVEYSFSGNTPAIFFANALAYFVPNQINTTESYEVLHTGQGRYMLTVSRLTNTSAFAIATNRQVFYQIYYDNGTVEMKQVTTTNV